MLKGKNDITLSCGNKMRCMYKSENDTRRHPEDFRFSRCFQLEIDFYKLFVIFFIFFLFMTDDWLIYLIKQLLSTCKNLD